MTDVNQTLLETKAKLLDAIEANQALHQHNQQLSQTLQSIAQILGLQPDETGNLELDTIVQAVAGLAVGDEEAKAEPEAE
ncbi:tail fiber chaperone [Acinetobacter phage vB_AbaM_Konradin]|uniref:Tail fiber assembly chaperone n=10 Tax=Lazarusvirus TaxID=2842820 RepID=A0A4Y1NL94_9CAUD|nr:tail fiber chaperone [Acinetobacter phage vB_ApiM_fHyAci03]YP_009881551.1 tail fiber chaperone [Acinetobacter phage KARL-1]YP_009885332.1 tail fiber chaperone [Acinetobacter phage vB_AbaM_Konradin]YP_009886178.1 tail fiber chaperone [Acinetobacter phage vB_AbaM_Berthold]YP_009886674.1 tail fiber chaperone [Acinetobacter phage vB_AbaM_Kimel]YP_009886921.1 tail fiber chaperone [Acinetobacter phage vB_AbaM_Lazarus]YP_009889783.1 tail fiber chaperone [Acinetobacter phage AM101]QGT54161.1 tail